MKNLLVGILLFGTISADAITQIYEGKSSIGAGQSCILSLQSTGDQITGFKIEGSAKSWEILSEKGGRYLPRTEIREESELDLMADFNLYSFKQQSTHAGSGIILKSNVALGEATVKSNIEIKITKSEANEINRITATQSFKALLIVPLAKLEFDCHHLVLKGEQP